MKKTSHYLLRLSLIASMALPPFVNISTIAKGQTLTDNSTITTNVDSTNSTSTREETTTTLTSTTAPVSTTIDESQSIHSVSVDNNTTTTDNSEILSNQTTVIAESQTTTVAALTLQEYKEASATDLADFIRQGRSTPSQLLDYAEQVIKETNPDLNNVITTRFDKAREELKAMVDTGQPFFGVPILVKGLGHSIEGGSNSLGIGFLADQISRSTSRYVKALQDAGFVVVGQSSYPQFGWINVTNSDLYGDTHNPWNLNYNPGGSSGGSSAAVAIGQVPVATTSDAGGSTRIPASFSSLIGLHPTRGILEGNSDSLNNQTSHFAIMRSMEDVSNLFNALLKDKYAPEVKEIDFSKSTPIAYTTKTPAGTPIHPEAVEAVMGAVKFLKDQGYQLVEVDYPIDGKAMMDNYYKLAASSAGIIDSQATKVLDRHMTKDDVELLTWALYQAGKTLTKDDINKAWEEIRAYEETMSNFYEKYPLFLTPTTAYPAPPADYHHIPQELVSQLEDMSNLTKEERMDLIYKQWLPAWTKTPYTQLANLTGTPSISLPTHITDDGLPIGISFGAAQCNDRLLMNVGKLFEDFKQFHLFYSQRQVEDKVEKAPETLIILDPFLEEGIEVVDQEGIASIRSFIYNVSFAGNQETGRQLLRELIVQAGQPTIIRRGTKVIEEIEEIDATPLLPAIKNEKIDQNSVAEVIQVDETEEFVHAQLPQTGDTSKISWSLIFVSLGSGLYILNRKRY